LAAEASATGRFASQILPLRLPDGTIFDADEGVRRDTSLEKLSLLKAVFQDGGTVSAGNASQVSDGAAALLIMTRAKAAEYGLRARARIVAQRVLGVSPELMLTGPIPATREVLARAGLRLDQIDLFEINEAFASVLGAWLAETGAPLERVNVCGGSIAIGHPLGSTGARLMTVALNELERRGARYALVSMCCGGGLGTATIIERLD
jgi:acetyl-CoA acetyltransferase family protein